MSLYAVHIPGPDETFPAPDLEEAERVAAAYNVSWRVTYAGLRAKAKLPEALPSIEATLMVVVRWPYAASAHADGLKQWNPSEWGVPPAPAPSIDTATVDMFGGSK